MENENKKLIIIKIVIAAILTAITLLFSFNENIKTVLIIIAYLICGKDVLIGAAKSIASREGLDEKVLMTIASLGAFFLGEKYESLAVVVLYQLGEMFEDYSMDKSRDNVRSLVSIAPEYANLYINGKVEKVNPADVKIGDTIIVNPFEKVPLDGEILDGSTTLNTSALTGESIPRFVSIGDAVFSGLINNENIIKIKVTKEYKESTATKIIELIENATEKKSKSENFITSFSKVYTPIVCVLALLVFICPVLYNSFILKIDSNISVWLYRALTILVISCPCAIIISVPLAYFASIGNASRKGILIKGSNYIEALSRIKTFAFDKTGTMTKGVFEVVGVHHNIMNEEELFKYVAHIEYFSNHPIAKSILKYYGKEINADKVSDVKEVGGIGLSGTVEGKVVLAGNEKLMKNNNIDFLPCREIGTVVHVAIDGTYEGHILIRDVIKENAKETIDSLKKMGATKTIMLTGDRENIAKDVSEKLGIDEYHAELLPSGKLERLEEIIKENKIAFIGDGVNDAPCITRADVGIAMGVMGSASAIDLADVVLVDDDVKNVSRIYKLSKKTMMIVYENIIFSIGIKVVILLLSAFGISNMWLAVFSDVGVMILAVLNSIRLSVK